MKDFRLLFFGFIFLFSYQFVFAQNEKRYKSKQEEIYFDSISKKWKDYEFHPVDVEIAKKIPYNFINVEKINNAAPINKRDVFSNYYDSIMDLNKKDRNNFEKFDSIMAIVENQKIGPIKKMSIVKEGRLGNKWGILYIDSKYDDFIYGGWGYWIAISNDNGKNWNQYYTGLTENYYFYFKRNSKIPLWKDINTIQIESAIVRQKSAVMHPIPAEYEIVEDNLAVEIDLSKIILDSDNDGLTDVAELKMLLKPNNPDTDGDGIIDSEDKNPRFKSCKTNKSIIYESLIENYSPDEKGKMYIDLSNPQTIKENIENSFDYDGISIFVTDNEDLQRIDLKKTTLIIMSSKEYEEYEKKYPSHFIKSNYSQMFKCDKKKDTYKIHTSYLTGGNTYLIKKTKDGWTISLIESWIS
jgi:hypothetical protein